LVQSRGGCDGDTVLLKVDQQGVACHTGHRSCFFTAVDAAGAATEVAPVVVPPEKLYGA